MKKLNENAIIELLSENNLPANLIGIGDDAAVILRNELCEVITKDLLIEDIHFRLQYFTPENLAQKALQVNLSDIAAMGATPRYIFLGLSIPRYLSSQWLEMFLQAFKQQCELNKVTLLGGDTTASAQGFFISITAIGEAQKTSLKFRNQAQAGNVICLLGYAGDAYAGLLLLEKNIPNFDNLKNALLAPIALIKEGIWLGKQQAVTAMTDTSDGLYVDLQNVCHASKVGAAINIDALPISKNLVKATRKLEISPIECALNGGEDYGLLFTVEKNAFADLQKTFTQTFATPLTAIGEITGSNVIELKHNHEPYAFVPKPFRHFE